MGNEDTLTPRSSPLHSWVIADSLKLVAIGIQTIVVVLFFSGDSKGPKRRIQALQLFANVVWVPDILVWHGLVWGMRSWQANCILNSVVITCIASEAVYLSYVVSAAHHMSLFQRQNRGWPVFHKTCFVVLIVCQLLGTLVLLITDAHHFIGVLRHAASVLVIAVLGAVMLYRVHDMTKSMQSIQETGFHRGRQNSIVKSRVKGLKRLILFGCFAIIFAAFVLSLLILHSYEDREEGPHRYSMEYHENLGEYNWKQEADFWATFLLACYYVYYSRNAANQKVKRTFQNVGSAVKRLSVAIRLSSQPKNTLLHESSSDFGHESAADRVELPRPDFKIGSMTVDRQGKLLPPERRRAETGQAPPLETSIAEG
mmetsp:Transcript_28540/g.69589  ORF Transcript_28540/g.69589 Transcript_28540/m.69589 type:complete len:370 (+) Transcript_28540:96-1205(+)